MPPSTGLVTTVAPSIQSTSYGAYSINTQSSALYDTTAVLSSADLLHRRFIQEITEEINEVFDTSRVRELSARLDAKRAEYDREFALWTRHYSKDFSSLTSDMQMRYEIDAIGLKFYIEHGQDLSTDSTSESLYDLYTDDLNQQGELNAFLDKSDQEKYKAIKIYYTQELPLHHRNSEALVKKCVDGVASNIITRSTEGAKSRYDHWAKIHKSRMEHAKQNFEMARHALAKEKTKLQNRARIDRVTLDRYIEGRSPFLCNINDDGSLGEAATRNSFDAWVEHSTPSGYSVHTHETREAGELYKMILSSESAGLCNGGIVSTYLANSQDKRYHKFLVFSSESGQSIGSVPRITRRHGYNTRLDDEARSEIILYATRGFTKGSDDQDKSITLDEGVEAVYVTIDAGDQEDIQNDAFDIQVTSITDPNEVSALRSKLQNQQREKIIQRKKHDIEQDLKDIDSKLQAMRLRAAEMNNRIIELRAKIHSRDAYTRIIIHYIDIHIDLIMDRDRAVRDLVTKIEATLSEGEFTEDYSELIRTSLESITSGVESMRAQAEPWAQEVILLKKEFSDNESAFPTPPSALVRGTTSAPTTAGITRESIDALKIALDESVLSSLTSDLQNGISDVNNFIDSMSGSLLYAIDTNNPNDSREFFIQHARGQTSQAQSRVSSMLRSLRAAETSHDVDIVIEKLENAASSIARNLEFMELLYQQVTSTYQQVTSTYQQVTSTYQQVTPNVDSLDYDSIRIDLSEGELGLLPPDLQEKIKDTNGSISQATSVASNANQSEIARILMYSALQHAQYAGVIINDAIGLAKADRSVNKSVTKKLREAKRRILELKRYLLRQLLDLRDQDDASDSDRNKRSVDGGLWRRGLLKQLLEYDAELHNMEHSAESSADIDIDLEDGMEFVPDFGSDVGFSKWSEGFTNRQLLQRATQDPDSVNAGQSNALESKDFNFPNSGIISNAWSRLLDIVTPIVSW